jgi:site-specific recombinase XerD
MASLLLPVATGESSSAERLRVAAAAYLARYRGLSRDHTASDLRVFLNWCAERDLDPLAAQRAHLELHVRWCQEVRRFKPSTLSRRTSVVCGFYRTCVIDGLLEHAPAQWLRRPTAEQTLLEPRLAAVTGRAACQKRATPTRLRRAAA